MRKQLCTNRFGQRLCFAAKTIVSSKGGGWWDWKCQESKGWKGGFSLELTMVAKAVAKRTKYGYNRFLS